MHKKAVLATSGKSTGKSFPSTSSPPTSSPPKSAPTAALNSTANWSQAWPQRRAVRFMIRFPWSRNRLQALRYWDEEWLDVQDIRGLREHQEKPQACTAAHNACLRSTRTPMRRNYDAQVTCWAFDGKSFHAEPLGSRAIAFTPSSCFTKA